MQDHVIENQVLADRDDVFVPGHWKCETVGDSFYLVSTNLYVLSNTAAANRNEPEPCPNCGGQLVKVTWRDFAAQVDRANAMVTEVLPLAREALEAYKQSVPLITAAGFHPADGSFAEKLEHALSNRDVERAVVEVLRASREAAVELNRVLKAWKDDWNFHDNRAAVTPDEAVVERLSNAVRTLEVLGLPVEDPPTFSDPAVARITHQVEGSFSILANEKPPADKWPAYEPRQSRAVDTAELVRYILREGALL